MGVELIERQGEQVIAFADPDGMRLELVAAGPEVDLVSDWQAWPASPVPEVHAIRGLHGVTATLAATGATTRLLTEILGLKSVGAVAARRTRFTSVPNHSGSSVAPQSIDLIELSDGHPGQAAVGTVHHIAWRVEDDAAQAAWREKLVGLGIGVSPVMDRTYFHAIYFREPGGVLFEIATNPPGFASDGENLQTLGSRLQLPPWLEGQRKRLEHALPPLRQPAAV